MASSLLALLDDIAGILDDVAALSKVAAKKTAGVLGDDLALNAQQVSGVAADRELSVVWAVAKGSLINKAILVPAALALSAMAPWAVTPVLMLGGAFLCFEGFEKLAHKFLHPAHGKQLPDTEPHQSASGLVSEGTTSETEKIRGAVRTDLILSAEIIAITLGTVQGRPFLTQLAVLAGIAFVMTVGVYGLVGGIVKLDDAGLYLSKRSGDGGLEKASRLLGQGILRLAPWLMKALSLAGTAAMFLVGGGILTHGLAPLHHATASLAGKMAGTLGPLGGQATLLLADGFMGLLAGALALFGVTLFRRLLQTARA